MQSPSFLDYQNKMEKQYGKSNAQSLFGIHKIPSMNQLRNILDPVTPDHLAPIFRDVSHSLYQAGHLEEYRSVEQTLLIALDGTDTFSSTKISCSCCTERKLKDGKTLYRHIAVTPVLVAPGNPAVIPLMPEYVTAQDGEEKQDCELNASKRWLEKYGADYSPWKITILGDDLYCHQPFCETLQQQRFHFILVCKPESHALIYEWVADFERNGTLNSHTTTAWNGKEHLTSTYRYINDIPIRNSDDAIHVNWIEITITDSNGKIRYKNAWVTSHHITAENMKEIVSAGRARWKVENENNNVLKNHGYQFEHNFGHGKQNLSNLLSTLIILAYLFHTVFDWLEETYKAVRSLISSRRTFFEHLRTLTQYLLFDNWNHLLEFMRERLEAKSPPDNKVLN